MADTQVRADIVLNGIDNVSAAFKKAKKSVDSVNDSVKEATKSAKKAKKSVDSVNDSVKEEAKKAKKSVDSVNDSVKEATKSAKKAKKSVDSVNDSVKKAAKSAKSLTERVDDLQPAFRKMRNVGAIATGAIAAGIGTAIKAASDLDESVNAISVVFGKASEEVKKLGEQSARTVGLSKTEFYALAVQLSSFAKTVAGEGGSVSGTLDEMTLRIADFASVMNLEVSDAATAFQSGLAGQTEPLRKFGIDLSAASVQAYAYANGIAEAGEQLTETQRIQATYGSLMEQTDKVAGDFSNTIDSVANRQKVLAAETKDVSADLGTLFVPAWQEVLSVVTPVLKEISQLIAEHPKLTVGVIATVGALAGLSTIIGVLGTTMPVVIKSVTLLSTAMKLATGQATVLTAGLAALPMALTIGVALAGFAVVMKQIKELRRETDEAYDSKMALEDLNQKAISRAKELKEAGDIDGAERLLSTVNRNINTGIEARANGGPVSANSPYLVGERGPELFVPRSAGSIVPNGMGTVNNFNFTFNGDVSDRETLTRQVIETINRQSALAGI